MTSLMQGRKTIVSSQLLSPDWLPMTLNTTRNSASIINKGCTFRRVVALFDNLTDLVREHDWWMEIVEEGLNDEDHPFLHSPGLLEFFLWIKAQLMDSEAAELERTFKEVSRHPPWIQFWCTTHHRYEKVEMGLAVMTPPLRKKSLSTGLPLSMAQFIWLSHQPWSQTAAWTMTSLDIFFVLLSVTETTQSKWLHFIHSPCWQMVRVRKNICEHHPDFLVTDVSWPRFLYDMGCQYDSNNIEKGLFKSILLLKVSIPTTSVEIPIDCGLDVAWTSDLQVDFYFPILSSRSISEWTFQDT